MRPSPRVKASECHYLTYMVQFGSVTLSAILPFPIRLLLNE